jgi:NADH:ubiquinone oxidoreductase subunit E
MNAEADSQQIARVVDAAIAAHGATREAIVSILSEVNRACGYIPAAALPEIRRRIHAQEASVFLADSHLYSAASFYHLFSLKPLGRHVVRFCESAPCHVAGGRALIEAVQAHLGLKPGETSADRQWSLLTTSCMGVCGVGPVLMIDDDLYGRVTPEAVPQILARYTAAEPAAGNGRPAARRAAPGGGEP